MGRGPSTPVVGLVLLGAGIAASTYGAVTSDSGNGAFWIAAAAIVSVLGMILVVPVLVATIARLSGRLPLTARYAARDAARHRTRTVPAVAAVAATVAGVVALGIANASDELQNEKTYVPQAQMGTGFVSWGPEVLPGEEAPDADEAWSRIEAAVAKAAPDVEVGVLRGPSESSGPDGYTTTSVEVPPAVDEQQWSMDVYGPMVTVADDCRACSCPTAADSRGRRRRPGRRARGRLHRLRRDCRRRDGCARTSGAKACDEGEVEHSEPVAGRSWCRGTANGSAPAPTGAVLPTALAEDLGLEVVTTSLRLSGDIDAPTRDPDRGAGRGRGRRHLRLRRARLPAPARGGRSSCWSWACSAAC